MYTLNIPYSVGISGVGSCVPEKSLTNDDLSKIVDTSDEWIRTRTGIRERRIADENMATSDLCTEAVKKAIKDANVSPKDVDLIVVATVTPDMAFPSTACIVQKNIGADNASAFDISVGCSGFLYGLAVGANFIAAGAYDTVVVVGAEILSRILDWEDRNTCVLFGDGAGACVLQRCEENKGILSYELGADGSNGHFLTQPAGGSRMPASLETVNKRLHYVHMDGREVFKFAVRSMEDASLKALEKANLDLEDVDYLIPHQANIRIIKSASKRLKIEENKVYVNLDKYGNVSSASIPIALDEALHKGLIKKDDIVLLVAFGAGLTWASVVLKWIK
ncbi:beta-ketoacyl-ACP synthase III [Anaerosalibacter massiliensis]|uniref:beta-ketoacyl-ACP synthase III n=1 Tax=Anaerosalibacter massiliensis TaxID=1347392 RepID=UPI0023ECB319|nr:beta-ketoacyl-ACP synthase III [Anaerosalibacter massiliensis]